MIPYAQECLQRAAYCTQLAESESDPELKAYLLKLAAVLDDVRLRGMTPAKRQTALRSLARVLLEASGIAPQEAGDDDDDLGRSASGAVGRPGFDRLVAALCAGQVGAVLCLDASRLARNGRDWHHLLELCGLVDARVIDLDSVYDPCRPNDRLLLGMKGSISEFGLCGGNLPEALPRL